MSRAAPAAARPARAPRRAAAGRGSAGSAPFWRRGAGPGGRRWLTALLLALAVLVLLPVVHALFGDVGVLLFGGLGLGFLLGRWTGKRRA